MRSVMLICSTLDTNYWMRLSIPGTSDIAAIQIGTGFSKVTFFSLYIDCLHSAALSLLNSSLTTHRITIGARPLAHTLWCRDFNHHHPLWDEECNKHLFTVVALRDVEQLLGLVANHRMVMALPKDLPTLELASKNWTQPDNVFCTEHTEGLTMKCSTDPCLRGPGTDHVPTLRMLEFPVSLTLMIPTHNYHMTDWKEFREELSAALSGALAPQRLTDKSSMSSLVDTLMAAIQEATHAKVPIYKLSLHSKCWWNKELSVLKKQKNKLSNASYKLCAIPNHPIHEECRKFRNHCGNEIQVAKRVHWVDFLEHMSN